MSAAEPIFIALQQAVAGRFSIEREIGRGGMGVVFLARDVLLDRHVAIKLLTPALGAGVDVRRRFLREARIAAQFFHPHIVPIHAVEETDVLAWIIMPYVLGETLAERVRRLGPLPAEEVRRLGREVGWALAYAHQRGVVHRDIKPENILIEAASGRFLIADFGIARANDGDISTSGAGAGTPRYMPPEQALGEPLDGRADLYALGATLYVAATGRPPFDARNSMALMAQHAAVPAPAVRTLASTLPVDLGDAIDRCLAKRPDDRHESAEKFVEVLTPAAADASVSPGLLSLAKDAQAVRSILGWAAVAEVTTLLLALGDNSGFQGITVSVGSWFAALIALGGGAWGGETLLRARRLLQDGHIRASVARALAGEVHDVPRPAASRSKHLLAVAAGAGLAVAETWLGKLPGLPDFLDFVWRLALVFGSAVLIRFGVAGALSASSLPRAFRIHIGRPLARVFARLAGRGLAESNRSALIADNAATEVVLDRAIRDAIAQLPPSLRTTIGNAAELASSLAREAEELRRRDAQLSDDARALRHSPDVQLHASQLGDVERARDTVRERLTTTIAALEAVRLDILRLEAGPTSSTGLTTNLEMVRDLNRRVDAAAEIDALLSDRLHSSSNP